MAEPARKQDLMVTMTVADLEALMLRTVKKAFAERTEAELKEVMNFKELCELVDASAPTVRRWIRDDDLPHAKLGGRRGRTILKFRRSEVLAWLAERGS
jgi:excisionase family DNA binding protein